MPASKYLTPSASAITRGSGHKAVAAAAYRSGSRLEDHKYQCIHNYEAKGGVVRSEIALPAGAPHWMNDREKLWNAVEAKEDTHNRRAAAQLAKEFMCPLPRELNEEQQVAVMRQWVGGLTRRGLTCDWSLHLASASDGGDNPHAHVMVVTRSIDPQEPLGFGRKWAGDPSITPGRRSKSPLDDEKTLERLKEEYTEIVNAQLAAAGSEVRITHLSNAARGIDALAGVHQGKAATALERKGERSRLGVHNRQVAFANHLRPYDSAYHQAQERAMAAAAEFPAEFTSDPWAFTPPAAEEKDWHKKVAEWQMLRTAAMAARDATQQSQSNVAAPPGSRSESATEGARQGAILAHRQAEHKKAESHQERVRKSREEEPGRGR